MEHNQYSQNEPSKAMDRAFIRYYTLFFGALVLCAGMLIYILISGDREIGKTDAMVLHTQEVITQAEKLATLVEGMLSSQRGYIISGQQSFLDEYESKRGYISEHIAALTELTSDNQSQISRLDEIRGLFIEFSTTLEERAHKYSPATPTKTILEEVQTINDIKDNIIQVNNAVLAEEYRVLQERIRVVESKKSKYFIFLLIGVVIAAALLLLFNGFLLRSQRKHNLIEASLKDTEQRFVLAVEGTQDGIFDWNLTTGDVFCSKRFFEMLGYERDASTCKREELQQLLHPEDAARAEEYMQRFLLREIPEYAQEFRMKRSDGRWIWVQSRAKAIFDAHGNARRMIGAHTDITHLKDYQEQLRADKEHAEAANRAKSDFLAHMSHEIRTPLTAISGIAEIFQKNNAVDEKHKKLVKTLCASTAALKDLISDILDFSKIESGELELDIETFRLGHVFEEVISMMSLRANEKRVSFLFDYSDVKNIDFYGDKARLRQILVNLIGNALKFTTEGAVTIKAARDEREGNEILRVDVSDTGIGIAPENFDLIFERFKQADSSVSRKYGGTGLGLPISKNLAKLMGGDIILTSQPGKGSTFSLLIPARTTNSLEDIADSMALNNKLNDKIKSVMNGESKILLVEDYEGNIVVIGHILREIGYGFDIAKTGVEALELWQTRHYDIILMDIQMPEMDGLTATHEIRRLEDIKNQPRTPIIGMTAHALVGDKDKCIAAGMDAYLPKPIVETDLKAQILKYSNLKRQAA